MIQMSRIRTFLFMIAVVSIIGFSVIAPAAAQEAPGEPANFWGEAVDEDGNSAPINTTIVAVVDGEVEDEITVEAAGQYGEEDAFGDKLSLDSDAGDTVSFHINDPNGEAALDNPHDLDSGTYELDLEFPAGTFPADSDNKDESSGDDDQSDDSTQDSSSGSGGGGQAVDSSDDSDGTDTSDDSSAVNDSDNIGSSDNLSENDPSEDAETTNEDTGQTDDSTPGFGTTIIGISIVTLTLIASRTNS